METTTVAKPETQVSESPTEIPPNPPKFVENRPEYLHQRKCLKNIMMEHCYARPYNWRPESSLMRPTKTIFTSNTVRVKCLAQPNEDELIDVENIPTDPPVIYDTQKARKLMEECEKHASFARDENSIDDDWEDKISRTNWSPSQNHLFNTTVNILNSDRMSRLAYTGVYNEPILRRTVIEKSVKRFRHLMAKYSWDLKLTQWLHQLLLDNLTSPYLAAYFDILQTLKHKLPTFVDKLMYGAGGHSRFGPTSNDSLHSLLKRPWDPVASSLNQDRPKKLPKNPVIIIVPSAPSISATMYSKRLHRWINLFSHLATVCTVYNNISGAMYSKLTMINCLDQMFAATRAKIQEVRAEYPTRPIILAGFNAGASLALQVAQVETVTCILCLGFSVFTVEGNRGEPDDNMLELQCPVLFVIGECGNTVTRERMEEVREQMRVETGLLVVGAGDDYLRITKKKKRKEGITQSVVDRCIVDEVGEFVSSLLLAPFPTQVRQNQTAQHPTIDMIKHSKADRRRNNSNGSSLDSEPPSPSPTPRIRPGSTVSPVFGRPGAFKTKSKIEARWHALQQGTAFQKHTNTDNGKTSNNPTANPALGGTNSVPSSPPPAGDNSTIDSNENTIVGGEGTKKSLNTPTQGSAKLQAMGIPPGRSAYHGSTLSNLLQGGVRTLPPNPHAKQLKANSGKASNGSKMAVVNSAGPSKVNLGNTFGNMVLLPDGKMKSGAQQPGIRPVGPAGSNAPAIFPKGKTPMPPSSNMASTMTKSNLTRYITSKKQLLANRSKMVKKIPQYIHPPPPPPTTSAANLPPPTNLTSQDIMDLPIIFADDNQILTNNTIQPNDANKLVFVNNKQIKRPNPNPPPPPNPIKYAKIILSKVAPGGGDDGEVKRTKIKEETRTDVDVENVLATTLIKKPNLPQEPPNKEKVIKSENST